MTDVQEDYNFVRGGAYSTVCLLVCATAGVFRAMFDLLLSLTRSTPHLCPVFPDSLAAIRC